MPVELVVACPHCGDPFARLAERDIDIHSGATYHCAGCGGRIVLSADTPEEYAARVRREAAS